MWWQRLIHYIKSRKMKIHEIKGNQPAGCGDGVLIGIGNETGAYMGGLKQGFKIGTDFWSFDFGTRHWTQRESSVKEKAWFHCGSGELVSMETSVKKTIAKVSLVDNTLQFDQIASTTGLANGSALDDYNMAYWTHVIYSINSKLFLSMGKSRQNKTVKTVEFDQEWKKVDLELEVAKKQKFVIYNNQLVLLGDDLRKVIIVDVENGTKKEMPLAYQRADKLDDKKPRRESYGLAHYGDKVYISGGYNVSDSAKYDATIFVIDLAKMTLTKLGALPYPRTEHSCLADKNGFLVVGGFRDNGVYCDDSFYVEL